MNDSGMNDTAPLRHQISRVRRETRRRRITVTAVERLTPKMQRLCFASPDLHDFSSLAPDDHIKLFLPDPTGPDPAGVCMRDYTPRRFDPAQGTLTIDFALHDAGPATAWALAAQVGDRLEIGGPRGSNVVADDFDWYLLIGDETALPAIGRRLEELRPGVPVTSLVAIDSDAERQSITTPAAWTPHWIARSGSGDATLLGAALPAALPPGDGYVWIAAEAQVARALRTHILALGHPKLWLKAAGYWARGTAAIHETIQD